MIEARIESHTEIEFDFEETETGHRLVERAVYHIDVCIKPAPICERLDISTFRMPLTWNAESGQVECGPIQVRPGAVRIPLVKRTSVEDDPERDPTASE